MDILFSEAGAQFLLRWLHFLFGITWIGLLYFFNLVNVNFMKALDAPTKGKVIPALMPNALWFFRWGAVGTWLTGFLYFAWSLIAEKGNHMALGIWLVAYGGAFAVIYGLLQPVSGALNKGPVLAAIIGVVVIAAAVAVQMTAGFPSNKTAAIGIGGGLGTIMLLNVWGIIWPHQKRIIAWTKESAEKGTPMPPEAAKLARRAFLASRTNAWLSIPMLFFMAAASHLPIFSAA